MSFAVETRQPGELNVIAPIGELSRMGRLRCCCSGPLIQGSLSSSRPQWTHSLRAEKSFSESSLEDEPRDSLGCRIVALRSRALLRTAVRRARLRVVSRHG